MIPLFVKQHYVKEVNNCHMDWKLNNVQCLLGNIGGSGSAFVVGKSVCYFRVVKSILSEEILATNRQEENTPMWDEDN